MFPQVGIFLVIAVVQQPGHRPEFFVFAIFASIETQGNFNREHMLLEILIFYMVRHELIGIITCWHISYSLCPSIGILGISTCLSPYYNIGILWCGTGRVASLACHAVIFFYNSNLSLMGFSSRAARFPSGDLRKRCCMRRASWRWFSSLRKARHVW